ncbi:DUF6873 family GME fold protein [Clostridium grantii]|uniref:DUF6873 domain-containing protein n=1 Tax=Clostridium grantii DSM 8605 TaxID=1121316 RepID=A0A1M5XKF5_9CLOT|nr:hypothetical protein [Clostridium grantii]SHI00122.1 hypothetical protein SAMN02745207_03715 [Clostridium grantii DSM 8605]
MKFFFVDYRISKLELENLSIFGQVILCPPNTNLYKAIEGHPDILMNIISHKKIIFHKDIPTSFIESLKPINAQIILSENSLKEKYPYDIILNSVNLANVFLHNLEYTDKNLLKEVKTKLLINVKQGYSKCSTAVVKEDVVMTSDPSIASALTKINFHVLLLPPGHIQLPFLNYGFIGGTCGLIKDNLLGFYGELENYEYCTQVISFLKKHNVDYINLGKGPLIDRGSILSIEI